MEIEGGYRPTIKKHQSKIPTDLYADPPNISVTLQQIEDLFRQRLEILHVFDTDLDYYNEPDGIKHKIDLQKNRLENVRSRTIKSGCSFLKLDAPEQRKLDNVSHYLTRLYCSRDPELWSWFVKAERSFLEFRMHQHNLANLDERTITSMLDNLKIKYKKVDPRETYQLIDKDIVQWSEYDKQNRLSSNITLFKVPFEVALSLMTNRRVSLMDGYAILTLRDLARILSNEFQSVLESTYDWASIISTQSEETNRLVSTLNIVYQDYKENVLDARRQQKLQNRDALNANAIDVPNIDQVAKRHFPPCMRHMLENLRKNHHLRHQARIYFGTFLRSGGVEMEQAIDFFRTEFTKKIPVDKFERDYKYNIRHLYGKEGHRKALTCFSCTKIINDNPPGPADNHACPFRHFDQAHLQSMLRNHEIPEGHIARIANIAETKNYQGACTEYFNVRHGTLPRAPIINPVQFYNDSMDPPAVPIIAPTTAIEDEAMPPEEGGDAPPAIESVQKEGEEDFEFDD